MLQIQNPIDDSINISGTIYEVNATFDNILNVIFVLEEMIKDEVSPFIIPNVILKLLINDILHDSSHEEKIKAVETILAKYLKKEEKTMLDISGEEIDLPEDGSQNIVFDYREDSELIYSAFMQTYGIDLIEEQGKLHWLKFRAMLNGLPENTRLSKVIGYRGYDPNNEKKSHKQQMLYLKRIHQLPNELNEGEING